MKYTEPLLADLGQLGPARSGPATAISRAIISPKPLRPPVTTQPPEGPSYPNTGSCEFPKFGGPIIWHIVYGI